MPKSNLASEIAGVTPEAPPAEAGKPKRRRTTRKVKQVFDARLATPPTGFRWVYNRLTAPYEGMFDGMVYAFEPNEYRLVLTDVAYFLWSNSIVQYSPVRRKGLRALALDSAGQMEPTESEGYGVPMDPPENPELIDRTGIGPVRAPGGLLTAPGVVSVSHPQGTAMPR